MDNEPDAKNEIQCSSQAMTEQIRMTNVGGDEVTAGGTDPLAPSPLDRGASSPCGTPGLQRVVSGPATGAENVKEDPKKSVSEEDCPSSIKENSHSSALDSEQCTNSDKKLINSSVVRNNDLNYNCEDELNTLAVKNIEKHSTSCDDDKIVSNNVDSVQKTVLANDDDRNSASNCESKDNSLNKDLKKDTKLCQSNINKEETFENSKQSDCRSPDHDSYDQDRYQTCKSPSYKISDRFSDCEPDLADRLRRKSPFLSHQRPSKSSHNDDKRDQSKRICSPNIDLKSHKSHCSDDSELAPSRLQQPLNNCRSPDLDTQDSRENSPNMTSYNASNSSDRSKSLKTSSMGVSPPPRIKMESPIVEEKTSSESGFGESHVNKLMSFVDSLDRKTSHSQHRLSSTLFASPLNKPATGSLPERSNTIRSSEQLYRPYKTSPAPLKPLTGKISGRGTEGKTESGGVDQPLDLSLNKGKSDSRESLSTSPHTISDYNGIRNPFGLSSLESMRAMFGEGSPMIPSVSGKSSDSKQNSWSGLANYPANINWQFASSLANLQAQMEAMLMSYPLFKASMDFYKTMMPPFVPNVASEKSANSPAHSTTGVNSSSHGKDKLKRSSEYEKRLNDSRTPNGHHRRSPAVSSSGLHSNRRVSDTTGHSEAKRFRTDSVPWMPSHSKHASEKATLSVGERKALYAQACRKTSDESRSSKAQSSLDGRKPSGGEPATSSSDEPHGEVDDRTMLTSFACGCGRRFSSLYQLTVHIEESGHSPSQVRVDSVDDFPKLVRGQDLWLSGGQDQRDQTLRCIRCKESFRSLPELTVHMIKSKHYVDIVGQGGDLERPLMPEGDILWKLHPPQNQNRYRNNSGGSSKEDEPIKWTCSECLRSYSYEEDLNRHLASSGHRMVNYRSKDNRSLRKSEVDLEERQKNFSPSVKREELIAETPRAASLDLVEDKKFCKEEQRPSSQTMYVRPSSVQSHTGYSSTSPNGEPNAIPANRERSSISPQEKLENELSRSPQNRNQSPGFDNNTEKSSSEAIKGSNSYYNDFISYKLKRPMNHSPSPVKNKRIKSEPNDEENRDRAPGDGYNQDYRTSTPGVERGMGNSPVRESSSSPKDDSRKGYMNLICPPIVETTDSSSTLKAMESFVERSFSSGKFNSPLSLSQSNLSKLGSANHNSHPSVFKSRSPGLDRNQLIKPYIIASQSASSENRSSSNFKDHSRNYEHADAKWLTRDQFSDRTVSGDLRSSKSQSQSADHHADGLLMIKQKKNNSLSDSRSDAIPTNFFNSSSPKTKLSLNNNDRKDLSKSSAEEKYKSDRTRGIGGDAELNHKKRQFTSSTLEYLQHFVDDAALKPTNSRDNGKKSLMSSESKLSIKIKAATANC